MVFGLNNERSQIARTPGEELEMIHKRMAERQERLSQIPSTPETRIGIASQELLAYKAESSEDVLSSDMYMSDQEVALEASTISAERGRQMDELLEVLVEKGLKNTLLVVDKINNPHLADDFHRFLIQYLAEGMDVRGLDEETILFKALHMKLFEVTLPNIVDVGEQGFKQLVRAMEQFYSGMLSVHEKARIKRYFTLEIALSSSSDDVIFYVAVPTSKVPLFEKQIMATFPSAQITPCAEDYNPFNEKGVSAGSIAKLTRPAVLPLRTFETFEQDPLNVILGVFSKMKRNGEGASIQIVVAPAGDEMNAQYRDVLKDVKKGTSLNRAMEGSMMKFSREIFSTAKEIFSSDTSKKKEEEDKAPDVDEEEVRAITEKISSPITCVNMRIIGSADTHERAEEIVSDLQSAFHQFSNEPSNSIGFRKVTESGLKKLLHDFSFRLYDEKYAMRLNLKEMTTMFHFPVTAVVSAELKQSRLLSAPAPMNMEEGGMFLGINNHRGISKNVYFAQEDRMRHCYVIGQTGTGKTTLLKNMIIQDIVNGEGVCYIDPHGTDIEDILNAIPPHRKQDVIYFDPSDVERPLGLNMLEYDQMHPEQKIFVVNELFSIFKKLYANSPESMGPAFEQYFRNATMLVLEDPASGNTLLEVSRVLADAKFRELKLSRCKNPVVVQFWREIASKAGGDSALANIVPYITNKFDVFLSNDTMRAIIAQETSSFNFREIMDSRKILLVNLAKGRLGDINSHLIGLILVGKMLMAALSRVDALSTRPADFYLYIDEFQNVTTDSISAILSEARKYRLSLTIAHQFIAQLETGIRDSVFGNVGSMMVFRVGTEDAQYLENHFMPTFGVADIMKIPNRNAYTKMLVAGFPAKPFNIETVAPISGDPEIGKEVKELSRRVYGRDRKVIEAVIAEKYAVKTPTASPVARPMPSRVAPITPPQVRPEVDAPAVSGDVGQSPLPSQSIPTIQSAPVQLPQTNPTPPPVATPQSASSAPIPKIAPILAQPVMPPIEKESPLNDGSSIIRAISLPHPPRVEGAVVAENAGSEEKERHSPTVYTNPFADRKLATPLPTQPTTPISVPAYGFVNTQESTTSTYLDTSRPSAISPQKATPDSDPLNKQFDTPAVTSERSEDVSQTPSQKVLPPIAPIIPKPAQVPVEGVVKPKSDPYREMPL